MKLLNESKIGGQTVMLRWRDGRAQAFGQQTLRIGEEGLSDCWLRWAWDGSRFVIDTDRFGLRPVYWAQSGDDFIVALDMRDLLAAGVSSQLDDQSVATFLCLGSYLSEATPFRAIQALPPGATLVWERGTLGITSRIRWPRADASISRDAALDQYVELFHAAIARRAERTSEIVLPLSGGLDSTHILLAMKHEGVQPKTCITVEDWFSDNTADVEAARESSRRLGFLIVY